MRSRYEAFRSLDAAHLLATWHPSTRPADLELDPETEWRALRVIDTVRGGVNDDDGVVEFIAVWRQDGQRGELHERSRFVREGGRWLYVDGDVLG
ncbi:preprotein translocase [Arthrobacter sp. UM1]|nr:preprotein translocase [Arthrobacter sp. UM1]